MGFCGDSIVLKPSAGPSIVNALKQNRSVSIAGVGRVKSVEHIRAGVLGGVVSMMSVLLLTIARRVLSILRLMNDVEMPRQR